MHHKKKLHQIKSVSEFENGYWYALELKEYARSIGIANSSRLRKDQLEKIIKKHIQSGVLPDKAEPVKTNKKGDILNLNTVVQNYISNTQTKKFILDAAEKANSGLPKKSGVWYWTNRWREEQIANKKTITYKDLVNYFVELSTRKERLPQIPSARFNNFISDFIADGAGTRDDAKTAWEQLKALNKPKTYSEWKKQNLS